MRIGYAGQASASVAPGVTVATVANTSDPAAAAIQLETAALQHAFDVTAGTPRRLYTARSLAVADDGSRIGAQLPMLSNGSSYDPQQNNALATILASAARTAEVISAVQTNYNHRGGFFIVSVTAAGTGTLTMQLFGVEPVTAIGFQLNNNLAITGTGRYVIQLYPGATGTSGGINLTAANLLPRSWFMKVTGGDGSSWTYGGVACLNV